MTQPLPPIALSPATLGALQARGATPKLPAPAPQTLTANPASARPEGAARRGQYLDIVV